MRNLRLYSDLPETHEDFKLHLWVGGDISKFKSMPFIKRVGGRFCDPTDIHDNGYKFFIEGASDETKIKLKECDFLSILGIFSTTSPTLNKGTIVFSYSQHKQT